MSADLFLNCFGVLFQFRTEIMPNPGEVRVKMGLLFSREVRFLHSFPLVDFDKSKGDRY